MAERMDIAKLGTIPISESTPCGENIRYEPEFEELQQEIDKLSSPSASGAVDWKKVENTASLILGEKSKDLLVAAYLAVALFKNRKEEGLVLGTRLIKEILATFWDGMFPPKKRAKGRIRIIEWWRDKTESLLEAMAPLSLTSEQFGDLVKDFEDIDQFLGENLKDTPSVMTIKRQMERVTEVKEPPKAAEIEQAVGTQSPQQPASAKAPVSTPAEIEDQHDFRKVFNSILSSMKKTASFLMENDVSNPIGYRIRRSAAWLPMTELPPSEGNRTKIPAPQPQVVTSIRGLERARDWKALLNASEARLLQSPLWLDLNYFTYQALNTMGNEFALAARAVEKETGFLVSFLSGLEGLEFSNGMSLSAPETLAWLDSIMTMPVTQTEGLENKPVSNKEPKKEDICAEAAAMARSGKLLDAVALLQKEEGRCQTARRRFEIRVCLVDLMTEGKKTSLAYAYCEKILDQVDYFHIDDWEPELAFQGLLSVWRCYNIARQVEKKKRAAECFSRMSTINLAKVMSLINE